MDGSEKDEVKTEDHLSSAVAFVEGGIQEACDDACSICLEAFCESDPSTITSCKHEFHLQCILEWCQRSSQCPMCWQPISFKDPTSQELLEAVERERSIRFSRPRNTTIFHHPTLGDFELQHLPVGANDTELEERIFQHLAAAAAMGRAHLTRREGHRGRHGRPQYLVFSSDSDSIPTGAIGASSTQRGSVGEHTPANASASPSISAVAENLSSQVSHPISIRASQVHIPTSDHIQGRGSSTRSIQTNQEIGGPSDLLSFSESVKSRLATVSSKYKESITRATRGWRERLFSRSTPVADASLGNSAEVSPGVTTITHRIEHLDTREGSGPEASSAQHSLEAHVVPETTLELLNERHAENVQKDLNTSASCVAPSSSA